MEKSCYGSWLWLTKIFIKNGTGVIRAHMIKKSGQSR